MAAALERRLLLAWTRRGPLALALWPISLVYRLLVALRHALYRSAALPTQRLPVPVVVVGNVVAGGAGKTPVVLAVVKHLRARGLRPGVISRGYGRRGDEVLVVRPDSEAEDVGDEPLLIRRRAEVPVVVGGRRADAGRALLARYPDTQVIVCDDGLQHHALQRDVEICVFDERGTGNGFLLPAGPLREPWPHRSPQRQEPPCLVLHTARQALDQGFVSERTLATHAQRADGSLVPLASLEGVPLVAVAGIARPDAFFTMLRRLGLTLVETEGLPDHYDFNSWKRPGGTDTELICTEKDAVKLWRLYPSALAVPLVFRPEPAFLRALDLALDRRGAAPAPTAPLSSP